MRGKKLIVDSAAPKCEGFEFVTESSQSQGKPPMYILKGIYAQADIKNGNGRIYPYEVLKGAIDKFDQEMVQTDRALGALEHPDHPQILPAESAIRILSLKEDNHSWIGESCILASQPEYGIKGTVPGDTLLSLVQYGTKMGFSTRCLGEVDESGIVRELQMCTIDCVSNPSIGTFCESNGNRFVNGILESKRWVCDNHGSYVEQKFENFEKTIAKMPNTCISEKKAEFLGAAITKFFESITRYEH